MQKGKTGRVHWRVLYDAPLDGHDATALCLTAPSKDEHTPAAAKDERDKSTADTTTTKTTKKDEEGEHNEDEYGIERREREQ